MLPKNTKRAIKITFGLLGLLFLATCYGKVSKVEFNDPWITIDPMTDQNIGHSALFSPYLDRKDSNILYLAEVGCKGEALRVDLSTKTTTPYKFNVEKWEDIKNFAYEFKLGFYAKSIFSNYEHRPVRSEFRGRTFSRNSFHMYGYPFANQPGILKAKFGFGTWALIDNIENKDRELVRYKIWNIETDDAGFGEMDCEISPDGKWVFYHLPLGHQPVFIFKRDQPSPTRDRWITFQPDYGALYAKRGVFKDRQ